MEPDGKQLAFTRYVEEKSQIFILSMEGGEPVQLTTLNMVQTIQNGPL
jgi:Tol biopolymer transport system component